MAKIRGGKTRPVDRPYEVWVARGGWEWRLLKRWQADDSKPYARWFCAVSSPFTMGGYDLGDCYVADIKGHAVKVSEDYEDEEGA